MLRILVVDDQHDVLAAIAIVLRIKGFEVVGAETGAAGLREFEDSNFDLAIVDIFLQGNMGGVEVMRSLRARRPTLPMIATSGVTALDFLTEYPELSNVMFLHKPFRPNQLMDAVEAALQTRLN
jgi:DNA-binding response OmpR family regulator